MGAQGFAAGAVFDGEVLHPGYALLVEDGEVARLCPRGALGASLVTDLGPGILAPGFVDLQVNGGGGAMLNNAPTVETLRIMAEAHGRLGATSILPTLITDTPENTHAAVEAVVAAIASGVPGIVGMHLEGPHLDVVRKGAHDPALIRPMTDEDLAFYRATAERLPALMITLAPESATGAQIAALAAAGIVVSLGHSDCDHDRARAAFAAGARCVTHLYNAMSPLTARAPGLVGAALDCGAVDAGIIADAIHVHPAALAAALRAKAGPGQMFLVSDAMAVAGSDRRAFTLNGRVIRRADGRLTLADGTLAGADLALDRAVRVCVAAGMTPADALARASAIPARVVGLADRLGRLAPGRRADFLWLDEGLALRGTWRGGARL
ncbi:MAG: N-acetylglucosamine-6-phosphate deacetylase [Roseivivax sp.]|nr:N-acetylglucosamine-6-phosphate deacetylase [Roseivivax sp.]